MKKITTLLVALTAIFTLSLNAQNAWINEIHYDNASTDVDEIIEVVIENPGSYTLSLFQVDLYNGNGGGVYTPTVTLDNFTVGNTVGNFTFYYYNYTANGASIQNGAPDGMALSYNGTLISGQFLSYEGAFDATDGPAIGVTSTDIGVAETSSTPIGESLQLTGNGTQYSDFTWSGPVTATPGALNNGQNLGGGPLPEPTNYPTAFAASAAGNMIDLSWTDATGTQLPGAYIIFISDQNNITAPVDGTPVADDLDLSDGTGAKNVNYGIEAYTFMNLIVSTTYYFAIYPYTNTGSDIDYKTSGTAPAANATTTNVILFEDFNWSWMAWTPVSVTGAQEWSRNNSFGIGGSPCAQMNGYSGSAQLNEDWLISPPMNLDAYTGEVLSFYTAMNYTGPVLEVKYSTDYDGGGDPGTATWTTITATLSPGSWAWTFSGNIDLSGISGTAVYLAFIYTSNTTNASTWEVDNVLVTGSGPAPADIVINEIMYNSIGADEEWIELYNNTSSGVDLSGWFIQDNDPNSTPIAIPGGTTLAAGDYFTISIATGGSFPFVPDLDGTTQADWSLNNSGDDVNLFNLGRIRADYVSFLDVDPWPTAPDGNGPSLSLIDPDYDNSLATSWAASLQDGGSPGAENFPPIPTINVTAPMGGEAWELGSTHDITWNTIAYTGNIKIELVDINSGSPQLLVYNIASSSNFWTWTIMNSLPLGDNYIIRISDLAGGPVGESQSTFSIVEPYVQPEIVITEIMYNPPESGNDSLEFIEIYNNGSETIDLTDFVFSSGVDFTFPAVNIAPAEYMVIAVSAAAMMNTFGVTAYEWTSGALSNSGELIELRDAGGMFVDSVRYDDALPWDSLADGYGPSLTLCDPNLDNGLAESWSVSTEFAAVNGNGDTIWATPLGGCSLIYPTANFEAADATVAVGSTTDFTDLSTGGTMVSWLWTFEGGDPASSTEQNPAGILYAAEGSYDVTLEVTNDYGETSSLTKTDYISVGTVPTADFEADATNPAVGQEVNFTDLSTGGVTEWYWEFEGGSPASSTFQNPTAIVYNAVGVYDVSLTVSNDYGSNTMLKENYMDVHPIGINELIADDIIRIYPNPTTGILNIENRGENPLNLVVYSYYGQVVFEIEMTAGTESINLSYLDAGMYFVRYISGNQQLKTIKLIIK